MTGNRPDALSDTELRLMNALDIGRTRRDEPAIRGHLRAFPGGWWAVTDLVMRQAIEPGTRTRQAYVRWAHREFAKLITHGLVERQKISGALFYRLTPAGRDALGIVWRR